MLLSAISGRELGNGASRKGLTTIGVLAGVQFDMFQVCSSSTQYDL